MFSINAQPSLRPVLWKSSLTCSPTICLSLSYLPHQSGSNFKFLFFLRRFKFVLYDVWCNLNRFNSIQNWIWNSIIRFKRQIWEEILIANSKMRNQIYNFLFHSTKANMRVYISNSVCTKDLFTWLVGMGNNGNFASTSNNVHHKMSNGFKVLRINASRIWWFYI